MTIFLERVDAVPMQDMDFTSAFLQWLTNMVDALNAMIAQVEFGFNLLKATSYTTAQITALAPLVDNGTFFYDTDTNQSKQKVNGVVVVLA